MTGKTLAHYQVAEKIGAGGMGEVWRARDTRLDRDVALKFLPVHFAQDPERLARFEREAKLLATLNHTNIAIIYGLEESDGVRFLALEYVPGETLKGPVALEDLDAIVRQLIDALEEAHENGVVHRDLKPANIKITPDGKVKVLDFGLAKALADEGSAEVSPNSPTLAASALTRGGVLLGTAAYMSPEQARGKKVDKRTDIFAFGSVVYEMLTGKQAFGGESISDSLGAILLKEPDRSLLPDSTPANLRRLLDRCLEKDPKRRLRDIGEARIILDEPLPPAVIPTPPPDRPGGLSHLLPWALAPLAALVAGLAVWLLARPPKPVPRPVFRATAPVAPTRTPFLAFSRDGSRVAYTAGPTQQVYIRAVDQLEAKPIPGADGTYGLTFSPDGQWLAFGGGPSGQTRKIKKVQAVGGALITLCEANPWGMDWGPDGYLIFGGVTPEGLRRVSAAGGKLEILTTPDAKKGETGHRWPHILPGGHAVLYAITGGADDAKIAVLSLETRAQRVLLEGGSSPRYVPAGDGRTGYLVYWRAGSLFAVPFDPRRLEVTGSAVPVLEGVYGSTNAGGSAMAIRHRRTGLPPGFRLPRPRSPPGVGRPAGKGAADPGPSSSVSERAPVAGRPAGGRQHRYPGPKRHPRLRPGARHSEPAHVSGK